MTAEDLKNGLKRGIATIISISEQLATDIGVGVPQGKTMLSGCVAFTIHDEQGMKIAY